MSTKDLDLNNIVLISGNSNKLLSDKISETLNIKLCERNIAKFSNTEIKINICENIRNKDVFIIQTGNSDDYNSVNDYIMETLLLIDACKRSMANTINLIMPCYPYARQDKKREFKRTNISKISSKYAYNCRNYTFDCYGSSCIPNSGIF